MKFRMIPAAGLAIALAASGCGNIAENLGERALEEAVEAGIEAEDGGNVEIDIDGDSGSITIEGEDGEKVSISGEADDEGGSFKIEGEDGETFEINGGDDAELPEDWPAFMPDIPGTIVSTQQIGSDAEGYTVNVVTTTDDPIGAHESIVADLEGQGFTVEVKQQGSTEAGENRTAVLSNDAHTVTTTAWTEGAAGNGEGTLTVSVTPKTS